VFLLWHLNFKFGKGATVFLGDFVTCRTLNCFLLWLGVSNGDQWAETAEHDAVMKCGLLECHTCGSCCAWAWQQSPWTFWTDVLQRCRANWSHLSLKVQTSIGGYHLWDICWIRISVFAFVYQIRILHFILFLNLDILVGYQIFTFLIRPRYQISQIFVIYLLVGC